MSGQSQLLVFGGRGAIGSAVRARFEALGWGITATSRSAAAAGAAEGWVSWEPGMPGSADSALDAGAPYSAVCWAQGANLADSVFDLEAERHMALYRVNCLFILESLRVLLDRDLLAQRARLVVVSSIWQCIARQGKLSYSMTKAALGGLVRAASVDLAVRGVMINAVLPSVLDTPMTAAQLSPAQVRGIEGATGFGRLTTLDDVVAAIEFLASERNTGITGQSLTVDLGFSHTHHV